MKQGCLFQSKGLNLLVKVFLLFALYSYMFQLFTKTKIRLNNYKICKADDVNRYYSGLVLRRFSYKSRNIQPFIAKKKDFFFYPWKDLHPLKKKNLSCLHNRKHNRIPHTKNTSVILSVSKKLTKLLTTMSIFHPISLNERYSRNIAYIRIRS